MPEETLQIRIHGEPGLPTLVYLPGLHGDWTLVAALRRVLAGRVRFVEVTYPRSLAWSVSDYAAAIEKGLLQQGIHRAWLLAESWGSQVAWSLLDKSRARTKISEENDPGGFQIQGLILAGGFVKHPWNWGPGLLRRLGQWTPKGPYRWSLKVYAGIAKWRHRREVETCASFDEFVARRTDLDRQVMAKRLDLLAGFDPRPIARNTQVPVYYLAGLIDPLIPWILVRRWLAAYCPGYRGGKTAWLADHAVLALAPGWAAHWITKWMSHAPLQRTD